MEFKKGTKLLLADAWQVVRGDGWAWAATLAAVLFVLACALIESFVIQFIIFVAFLAFVLFALYKAADLD